MNKLLTLNISYSEYFKLLFTNKEHQEMARIEFEEELRDKYYSDKKAKLKDE